MPDASVYAASIVAAVRCVPNTQQPRRCSVRVWHTVPPKLFCRAGERCRSSPVRREWHHRSTLLSREAGTHMCCWGTGAPACAADATRAICMQQVYHVPWWPKWRMITGRKSWLHHAAMPTICFVGQRVVPRNILILAIAEIRVKEPRASRRARGAGSGRLRAGPGRGAPFPDAGRAPAR